METKITQYCKHCGGTLGEREYVTYIDMDDIGNEFQITETWLNCIHCVYNLEPDPKTLLTRNVSQYIKLVG